MELMRARGTRDFLPEQKLVRDWIMQVLKKNFERYGYRPLETPVLERFDVLASKYTGGAEILKETFSLKDQGDRDLALRYDLTVPMCRVIAMNPNLRLPFKRYQMDKVFRDGPVEKGRVREFYQCDVDIVGVSSMLADAEVLALSVDVMKDLGLNVVMKVNNRKVLDAVLDAAGVVKDKSDVLLTIDKLYKIQRRGVEAELKEKGLSADAVAMILDCLTMRGANEEKIKQLRAVVKNQDGLDELEQLFAFAKNFGVKPFFDPSLARGLTYYTGTIFEIVLLDKDIGSIGGGGRYDTMIGNLVGSGSYPAMGISFGLDRIYDVLIESGRKFPLTPVEVFVIPIKTLDASLEIVKELRLSGVNVDMDMLGKAISKNLDYANKLQIPFVVIVGDDEVKQKKVKLKNMVSGEECLVTVADAVEKIKVITK
ncbi:MAG: histidine--tRNA ligase [Nanoarchaeota archaeon]|nr:histidine--tRNA ligase [Nanoarchaeota archaeon]